MTILVRIKLKTNFAKQLLFRNWIMYSCSRKCFKKNLPLGKLNQTVVNNLDALETLNNTIQNSIADATILNEKVENIAHNISSLDNNLKAQYIYQDSKTL